MTKIESRVEVLNYIQSAKKEADALIILLQKQEADQRAIFSATSLSTKLSEAERLERAVIESLSHEEEIREELFLVFEGHSVNPQHRVVGAFSDKRDAISTRDHLRDLFNAPGREYTAYKAGIEEVNG